MYIMQDLRVSVESINKILLQQDFWRFFVDGAKQKSKSPESKYGPLNWYSRESHGLEKMKKAAQWLFTEKNVSAKLSAELIEEVHKLSFPLEDHLLKSHDLCIPQANSPREFNRCKKDSALYLTDQAKKVATLAGYEVHDTPWKIDDAGMISPIWSYSKIQEALPKLIESYYESLSKVEEVDTKVIKIVEMAQILEDLHPFADGNCRVFITLLLNKELIAHGFSPAIFENPNDFDYLCQDKMGDTIIKSQQAYQSFFSTGYPYKDCLTNLFIATNIVTDNIKDPHFKLAEENSYSNPYLDTLAMKHLSQYFVNIKGSECNSIILLKLIDVDMMRSLGLQDRERTNVSIFNFKNFYKNLNSKEIEGNTSLEEIEACLKVYKEMVDSLTKSNLDHYSKILEDTFASAFELLSSSTSSGDDLSIKDFTELTGNLTLDD